MNIRESGLDLGIWGPQIRYSYFMRLVVFGQIRHESNIDFLPSTAPYLGPKYDGVEDNNSYLLFSI